MTSYTAYEVSESADGAYTGAIVQKQQADLPAGDILIEVFYSSVNFKDALSASGNKGVTRHFPHVPGIDAVGKVVESSTESLPVGTDVIVTGYDLGMGTAGGFGQRIRVPAAWVARLPKGMSPRSAMVFGTAGLTAALCVDKLLKNGVVPESGSVLVTGSTGGVGIVACALLVKLGFDVVASTGKPDQAERLLAMGVKEIVARETLSEDNPRPLLKETYAGAIDVVGGKTLANVLKVLRHNGSVAACGLVESTELQATVLPFILRGVNLLGVDSVEIPLSKKQQMWDFLADEWALNNLDDLAEDIALTQLAETLSRVLSGGAVGRYVVDLNA
ncbi:MAG: YhdH/YhfP family quinone oxidoreductase [Gammaproteobacteria bacterium]|nr:YhdH/YhfP family quinone oxidoreductase [Gammaproteobacteria bacterium]